MGTLSATSRIDHNRRRDATDTASAAAAGLTPNRWDMSDMVSAISSRPGSEVGSVLGVSAFSSSRPAGMERYKGCCYMPPPLTCLVPSYTIMDMSGIVSAISSNPGSAVGALQGASSSSSRPSEKKR